METTQIALILVLIVLAVMGFYLTSIPTPEITTTTTSPLITTTPLITTSPTIPTTTITPTITVTTTTQVTTSPIAAEGILLMKIKDKLDLTNITAINITIDKVEVHKAGNDDETQSNETFETNNTSSAGWDTVVDETKSYNLLELVDTPGEVLGETALSTGKYTQIRLSVVEAKLTLDNESYDVKVPSKRFYWIHPFNIESGKITTLTLDFDAADSIKETGSNKYILKPVVKIIGEVTTTTSTTTTLTTTVPTIDIDLILNGTQGDFYYQNETYANFTVTADATVLANLTTNMTGWADKSSITPYYEYPHITCDVNDTWYNVTAFTGNNSWKYDYETHYAICYVTTTTTTVPENVTVTTVD